MTAVQPSQVSSDAVALAVQAYDELAEMMRGRGFGRSTVAGFYDFQSGRTMPFGVTSTRALTEAEVFPRFVSA